MNQSQLEKLRSLDNNEIATYLKVKSVLSEIEDSYICTNEHIFNWFGRTMKVGEIISATEYREVDSYMKNYWRPIGIEELMEIYKINSPTK